MCENEIDIVDRNLQRWSQSISLSRCILLRSLIFLWVYFIVYEG